jgi:hypothetical protein
MVLVSHTVNIKPAGNLMIREFGSRRLTTLKVHSGSRTTTPQPRGNEPRSTRARVEKQEGERQKEKKGGRITLPRQSLAHHSPQDPARDPDLYEAWLSAKSVAKN